MAKEKLFDGITTLEQLQNWRLISNTIHKIRNNNPRFEAIGFGWSIPESDALLLFGTDAYKFMLELSHALDEWVSCYDWNTRQFYINDTGLKMMWWYRALKLFREVKKHDTDAEREDAERECSVGKGAKM